MDRSSHFRAAEFITSKSRELADKSTANENISRFRQRVEDGVDRRTRATLLGLLLLEEDMLGRTRAQLDRADRHIARLQQTIQKMEERARDGFTTECSQALFETMHDLLATYRFHRSKIAATLALKA